MHVEVSIIFPMLAATYSVPDFIKLLKQNLASHITSQQKASSDQKGETSAWLIKLTKMVSLKQAYNCYFSWLIMVSRRVFGASCKSFAVYPVPIIYGAIIFRD
jgi:hypothetical protein